MAAASSTVIEQLAQEVKKVWALADKDGNGKVDGSELKAIMTAVLKEEPTEEETQKFLNLLDIDGSGTVEIREFLRAMASWLEEDYRSRPSESDESEGGVAAATSRKRQRYESSTDLEEERRRVHKKIRGFFLQFRTERSLADIQRQLVSEGTDAKSQRKLGVYKQAGRLLGNTTRIYEALFGDSALPYMDATKELADALSIVEVFETPIERRSVAEVIIKLFQFVVQKGLIPRLMKLLRMRSPPSGLQYHAMRCLTYVAVGPSMAGTPESSPLYPRKMFLKRILVTENIGDLLVDYLDIKGGELPAQKLREQTVRCVAAFASHDPDCRSYLLSHHVLPPILRLTNKKAPIELLRQTAAAISVLCGVTHPIDKQPAASEVAPALPIVASMLKSVRDAVVVQHCCATMSLVLPTRGNASTCTRLVELLAVQSPPTQIAALETITAVCSYDERQMLFMVDKANLLAQCRHLIDSHKMKIRIAAYSLLQRIAERGGTAQIIDANIVPVVVRQLQLNDPIRWKIMKFAKLLTRGNSAQIKYLVDEGIVPALTSCLANFKCYDTILTEMYGYVTPSFNFEFVNDALGALGNVLNVGQMEAEETGHPNRYALAFDLGSIDTFASLLRTMKEARDQLKPWRQGGGGLATEETIKRILARVKASHERKGGPVSKACAEMIVSIWHNYFEEHTSTWQNKKLLLKVQYRGCCVLDEISPSLTYAQLCTGLRNKFGKDLQISFRSHSAEVVIVDSQVALEQAFKNFQNEDTVKLDLQDRHDVEQDQAPQVTWLSGGLEEQATTMFRHPVTPGHPVTASTSLLSSLSSSSSSSSSSPTPPAPLATTTTPPPAPMSIFSALPAVLSSSSQGSLSNTSSSSSSSSRAPYSSSAPIAIPAALSQSAGSPSQSSPQQVMSPRSQLVSSLTMRQEEFSDFDVTKDLEQVKKDQKMQIFQDLQAKTHFGAEEIERLFQHWLRHSTDGRLSKTQFADGLRDMGIADEFLIAQIFAAFDEDRNGRLDFREFVVGMSTVQKGSPTERLRFMFRAYDTDGSGYLSPDEVYHIFRANLASQGKPIDPASLSKRVTAAFEKVDTNHDGKLSFEEFARAVRDGYLAISLPGSISQQH